MVGVAVRNLSGTPRKPGISFARTVDSSGATHLADAVAQIGSSSGLLDDLARGGRVIDRLYFDVPASATLTSVVLRESANSEPTTVSL
ncbi:hypothetical protein [Actinoplanes solisilvae]|uniref:hypothetical protein n=1 Tax=Actinoplanes solisilvae TaxID=2486853 RepID=UPI000FDC39D7|nr:hypothetical protein [Actinoplanes solisilvae]